LEIFRYNDESAHNLGLAEEASIIGESFEILYMDSDAQIRFKALPSEEVILVCEATLEENILYVIRRCCVYDFDGALCINFPHKKNPAIRKKISGSSFI